MPTQLSAFMPLVLPYVPGCAEIAAEAMVRQAAIEFCTRSLAHQRTLDAVATDAGSAEVDFDIGKDVVVAKLLACWLNRRPLGLAAPAWLDGRDLPLAGMPKAAYVTDGTRKLFLDAIPGAGQQLVARVALRPSMVATTLDDALFERYSLAISHRAIALLAAQPDKSYSNPQVAMTAQGEFDQALTRARVAVFKGHSRAAARVTPDFF